MGPMTFFEAWTGDDRLNWDSVTSFMNKIVIAPNTFILNFGTKRILTISPRDFVDLLRLYKLKNDETGYEALEIAQKSISYKKLPKQKGYVRANNVLNGVLFEKMSKNELKQKGLPSFIVNGKECEWTKIRIINQSDIKGWIPSSVINSAFTLTANIMMKDLRNYVIYKRLKLK